MSEQTKFRVIEEFDTKYLIVQFSKYSLRKFEIVSSIPTNYEILDISPQQMPDGYVPFCRANGNKVDEHSLKALPLDGAEFVLGAASILNTFSQKIITDADCYLEKYLLHKRGDIDAQKVEYIQRAIPHLQELSLHWK